MYLPLNYSQLNNVESSYIPSMTKNRNNLTYAFWERSLFQRACSTVIFNLPEDWSGAVRDFFYWCIFRYGFIAVFDQPETGLAFQPCSVYGFNFYYQPTNALVVNPAITRSLELTIGKDTELIKLTPDYQGIWDIISYYAEKLSLLDTAINMSIINSKFAYAVGAKNRAASETLKKIFDKINRGEPAVCFDAKLMDDQVSKSEPWQFLERKDLKSSYLTTDQLKDFQTLLNNFDTEVGIPTIPYEKKERMVTSEAESRIIDSTSRSIIWHDTLTSSIEKVNKMFGTSISVEMRYQEGGENESGKDDTDRNVSVE